MTISFDLKSLVRKARENIGLTLWLALLVLILLEGLVVQRSLSTLLSAGQIQQNARTQPVRVNFNLYDTIAKRFEEHTSFVPTPVTALNPFGTIDIPPPAR